MEERNSKDGEQIEMDDKQDCHIKYGRKTFHHALHEHAQPRNSLEQSEHPQDPDETHHRHGGLSERQKADRDDDEVKDIPWIQEISPWLVAFGAYPDKLFKDEYSEDDLVGKLQEPANPLLDRGVGVHSYENAGEDDQSDNEEIESLGICYAPEPMGKSHEFHLLEHCVLLQNAEHTPAQAIIKSGLPISGQRDQDQLPLS